MKVSDSDVIKTSEKDLIDAIAGELDWEAIENLFKEKHNLILEDELEYKNGDIVIHNSQIAYKLNFDIKVNLSVLFDRNGECLGVNANEKKEGGDTLIKDVKETDNIEEENPPVASQDEEPSDMELSNLEDTKEDESISEIANEVAVMIPDIKNNPGESHYDQDPDEVGN
jgi:hypothetical protein